MSKRQKHWLEEWSEMETKRRENRMCQVCGKKIRETACHKAVVCSPECLIVLIGADGQEAGR